MIDRWRHADLRECVEEIRSGKSVNSIEEPANSDQIGVLKTSCVYNGKFDPQENKAVIPEEQALVKCPVTARTVIVSRMNTADLVGASGYVDQDHPNIFLPDRLWAVVPKQGIDPVWLYYVISSPEIRARLSDNASGTSASMKNISQDVFLSMPARIPPLSEQRKIAEILRTWDEAIEKAGRVLTAKTSRREHWHTALVVQFDGSTKPLHELITPVQRPVPRPSKPYGAIGIRSHGKGTFHRHVSRPEQIDMDTLFVVKARDLIVNITFAWEGAIALATPRDEGRLVSHRFPTFQINEDVVNRGYLGFAVNNPRFFYALRGISPGSAGRNRVLNQRDFLQLSIPFPPKKQQDRITQLLTAADEDIATTADLIAQLKAQKRGLMQKLLTGQVRVPKAVADLSPAAD